MSFDLGWCLVSLWFGFVFILGDYVCFGLDWFGFLLLGFGFYFALYCDLIFGFCDYGYLVCFSFSCGFDFCFGD